MSGSNRRFWLWVLLAVTGWLAFVLSLEARNPRLIASWHGFLHTAIANRFPAPTWTPENPFFAGEPLRYYWVYHRIGAGLGSLLGMDPLSALRLLALVGLVLLVVTAALLGRRLYGTTGAGIMIGTLALVGLNPLGPGIAAARHFSKGAQLFEQEVGGRAVETTFVSNELADQLMSRKLLPSMYFSTDWRQGQNVVWFFDISSRGLALGVLMTLLLVLLRPVHRWPHLAGAALLAALLAALNPIVGIAVAGGLGFSYLVLDWRGRGNGAPPGFPHLPVVIALATGVLLAAPTFIQLFGQGGSATSINPPAMIVLKLINMGLNFGVIAVLVLLALRSSLGELGGIRAAAITGALLLFAVALVHLEEGNEHNLTNAALVVLAVPAVAALILDRTGQPRPQAAATRRLWLTGLLFLPVTCGTWLAFDGRPPLPFTTERGVLARVPAADPLAELYQWIGQHTGRNAVFVVNPERPVKMSGNVSELPAFTGRTLFIDQPSYLTTVYADATMRAALAGRLLEGDEASAEESAYLERLKRPLYIISYQPEQVAKLSTRYGNPAFQRDFVSVFAWK
jgi:hypothetical protein